MDDDSDSSSSEASESTAAANALQDLTAEQVDKLLQLQDLTGMDDIQLCRALLESKAWDLEATVREQRATPETDHGQTNGTVASVGNGGASGIASLLRWGFFILSFPVAQPLKLAFGAIRFMFSVLSSFMGVTSVSSQRALTSDSLSDVVSFKRNFECHFGSEHPPFYMGSYSQALEEAKRDLRFLLVYLHCPDHQDTAPFCLQTLSSPEFSRFVSDANALFWACSVNSDEGHRVSQALRESTYPFLAVTVLRQNRMMIVGRIEGLVSTPVLIRKLESLIRDNEAYIVAGRAERLERSVNESIRREQDEAFADSLRQDQERERQKREAEELKRLQEEQELQQQREEEERKESLRRAKIDLVSRIPEEPDFKNPDAVRILVKLPSGQRLERRFLKSESLCTLYYYVFCHPDSPDEFDITTNFPKRVIRCKPEDNPASFDEAGLGQSTMLFVNDLEA
jgi:FAS-associated factor 2